MDRTCVDSAIEQLSRLLSEPCLTLPMKQQIQTLQLELRFLKMFSCCLAKLEGADKYIMHMGSVPEATSEAAVKALYQVGYFAIIGIDVKDWDLVASDLLEKVSILKPEIRKISADLLDCSLLPKSSSSDEIVEFIDSILTNLMDLVSLKAAMAVSVIKQVQNLEEKLRFSRSFVDFTAKRCSRHGKLEDFLTHIKGWANSAALLSLLYWVDGMNENMAPQMNGMLSDMLLKIMPYTPAVAEMYLGILKASNLSQPSDNLLMGEIVANFVDFLLENLVLSLKDHCEILREGLIFLITLLMDPPKESRMKDDTVKSLLVSLISSLFISSEERNNLLPDLLQKIEKVKAEVRELYLDVLRSTESNCPKTHGMGFIDFFRGNLGKMMQLKANCIPFAKHKVMTVREELLCFKSFLEDIMNMQNKHEELKALRIRIINLAYLAEHVFNSCLIQDIPIWYKIICFSNILEEIKVVKTEVMKMKQKYKIRKHTAETNSKQVRPSRANTSKTDEIVGFNDEAEELISVLTRGSKKLEIVSIVGMPGVGKTTLAKKVYNDPSVVDHFHKRAWCFVSQSYTSRDLLLAILRSVSVGFNDVEISKMTDEALELKLMQCLRREKYLVVMDDIWDTGAWNIIKQSLPDDENASRIMFTTQNHNLTVDVEHSSTYPLSPLIEEKSWEFLQEKLFQKVVCPQELSEVGKKILIHCQGLPLAIIVIAGLLAKEKENVEWWKQVEESLNSNATSEGYMGTLELSYNHLRDPLKPCFLYFGAFRKGEVISARKLCLLWNAEGLIEKTEIRSSEVAKKYLLELSDRSLLIVSKRSSDGGIKACRVHDLLYNFCSEKAKEETFLHVVERSEVSDNLSNPKMHGHCRLCIHAEWETFMNSESSCRHVCSLLFSGTVRWNQSYSNFVGSHFYSTFKLLKVLNLERVCLDCPFPEEIISIIHLRYLGIWGCIRHIPTSIANLWNLETLIVKGVEYFIHLPDTIWKMKSLKHVDVSEAAVLSLGGYEAEESCRLDNIETFSSLTLSHDGDTEKLLRRLTRLRKLRCVFLESNDYRKKGIQFPSLASLQDLESLKVSTNGSHEQVFYCWMRIQFQGFNFPSKLKKLTLYKLGLPWSAMSTIRKLDELEVLKLRQEAFRGKRWDMEDEEFENLKHLELSNLNIVQWKATMNPFPRLERLVIGDCYELEEIPLSFADINDLDVIQLQRCSKKVEDSASEILNEQKGMGNDKLTVSIFH